MNDNYFERNENYLLVCRLLLCNIVFAKNAIEAPLLDMTAHHQIVKYQEVCTNPYAVEKVISSLYIHTCYLDTTQVPWLCWTTKFQMLRKKTLPTEVIFWCTKRLVLNTNLKKKSK